MVIYPSFSRSLLDDFSTINFNIYYNISTVICNNILPLFGTICTNYRLFKVMVLINYLFKIFMSYTLSFPSAHSSVYCQIIVDRIVKCSHTHSLCHRVYLLKTTPKKQGYSRQKVAVHTYWVWVYAYCVLTRYIYIQ